MSLLFRRASSVNLSLEKLAEAPDDSSSTKPVDVRAGSLERQSSTEAQPPPKPPHTYYNRHRYPEGRELSGTGESLHTSRETNLSVSLSEVYSMFYRVTEQPDAASCSAPRDPADPGPACFPPVEDERLQEVFHKEVEF